VFKSPWLHPRQQRLAILWPGFADLRAESLAARAVTTERYSAGR
jgi:hypothetical protein